MSGWVSGWVNWRVGTAEEPKSLREERGGGGRGGPISAAFGAHKNHRRRRVDHQTFDEIVSWLWSTLELL